VGQLGGGDDAATDGGKYIGGRWRASRRRIFKKKMGGRNSVGKVHGGGKGNRRLGAIGGGDQGNCPNGTRKKWEIAGGLVSGGGPTQKNVKKARKTEVKRSAKKGDGNQGDAGHKKAKRWEHKNV